MGDSLKIRYIFVSRFRLESDEYRITLYCDLNLNFWLDSSINNVEVPQNVDDIGLDVDHSKPLSLKCKELLTYR